RIGAVALPRRICASPTAGRKGPWWTRRPDHPGSARAHWLRAARTAQRSPCGDHAGYRRERNRYAGSGRTSTAETRAAESRRRIGAGQPRADPALVLDARDRFATARSLAWTARWHRTALALRNLALAAVARFGRCPPERYPTSTRAAAVAGSRCGNGAGGRDRRAGTG